MNDEGPEPVEDICGGDQIKPTHAVIMMNWNKMPTYIKNSSIHQINERDIESGHAEQVGYSDDHEGRVLQEAHVHHGGQGRLKGLRHMAAWTEVVIWNKSVIV